MSISCMLALTACLHTQGSTITGDHAEELLSNCQVVSRLTASDFEGGIGSVYTEIFIDRGLDIQPGDSPGERRNHLFHSCNTLERDFNSNGQWQPTVKTKLLRWVASIFGIN